MTPFFLFVLWGLYISSKPKPKGISAVLLISLYLTYCTYCISRVFLILCNSRWNGCKFGTVLLAESLFSKHWVIKKFVFFALIDMLKWWVDEVEGIPFNPFLLHLFDPILFLSFSRSQQCNCCSHRVSGSACLSRVRRHSLPHLLSLYESPAADRRPDPLIPGAFPKPRTPSSGSGRLPFKFGRRPGNQRFVWCLWLW